MSLRTFFGSTGLLISLFGAVGGLAAWKQASLEETEQAFASQPEPLETVAAAVAGTREHARTTVAVGTVLALRSVTLRNELPGTVRHVALQPGAVVEEGAVLVALDVAVEEAELRAAEAEAALAESLLRRVERSSANGGTAEAEVDRARAQPAVTRAEVQRIAAVIERKTVRAPFRARVGMADVHPGQYLNEGTVLTTLQGVDDAVHVDFSVPQDVAARLAAGDTVAVLGAREAAPAGARIVAVDARVDPHTRNAVVRARVDVVDGNGRPLAPGSAVRVRVPTGEPVTSVAVPVSALRKGPSGEHVFVLETDAEGNTRAHQRPVVSGPALGDETLITSGLKPGETVAASGSFKLYEGVLVSVADARGAGVGAGQ